MSGGSLDARELQAFGRAEGAAVARLLDRYRAWLNLLARLQIEMHLDGQLDAMDIAQQTLLEAFRRAGRFRGSTEVEFVGWLRGILAEVLRREVQSNPALREKLPPGGWERNLADLSQRLAGLRTGERGGSKPRRTGEQQVMLADALARLPRRQREVLILHHLEARTHEEVAVRLECSPAAARRLWLDALRHLRQQLPRDEGSDIRLAGGRPEHRP